jgi:hypothetical protein
MAILEDESQKLPYWRRLNGRSIAKYRERRRTHGRFAASDRNTDICGWRKDGKVVLHFSSDLATVVDFCSETPTIWLHEDFGRCGPMAEGGCIARAGFCQVQAVNNLTTDVSYRHVHLYASVWDLVCLDFMQVQ